MTYRANEGCFSLFTQGKGVSDMLTCILQKTLVCMIIYILAFNIPWHPTLGRQGKTSRATFTSSPILLFQLSKIESYFETIQIYAMHTHTPRKIKSLSKEHFGEKQPGYITNIQTHREIYIGFMHLIYFAERNLKVFGIGGFL